MRDQKNSVTLDDVRRMALEPDGIPQWRRGASAGLIRGGRGVARFVARHWLALLNAFNLLLISIALLDPFAWDGGGETLYRLCGLLCTQTPGHMVVINGRPVGLCQRCLATYGAMAVLGVGFVWLRRHVPHIPFWTFALLAAPLVVDGGTQYIGWRDSDAVTRAVTGALFGLAVVWYIYPSFERGFRHIAAKLDMREIEPNPPPLPSEGRGARQAF